MQRFWIGALILLALAAPCLADNSVRESGREIAQGVKKVGHDTGKAFKEGGKEIGRGFKKLGKGTGNALKEGGKETGHAVKKSGKSLGGWFRGLGHSFNKFFTGA